MFIDSNVENKVPKVSIGMPIRNGGDLLKRALDSIINQTFTDFELIISDNGSTDGSSEILQNLAKNDSRVKYFYQDPPLIVFDNFEFVLKKATGEYFMWAAHDDYRSYDFIEKLANGLDNKKDAILAFCDVNVVTIDDYKGKKINFDFDNENLNVVSRVFKESFILCYHFYALWRLNDLLKIPFNYCAIWPDKPILLSASILGKFIHVEGPIFYYFYMDKGYIYRIQNQDYSKEFNKLKAWIEVEEKIYTATNQVGNPFLGAFSAGLFAFKNIRDHSLHITGLVIKKAFGERIFQQAKRMKNKILGITYF
ncbi:glycosyltransferase [Myxococcota bacterium]|nr:glycosyltransferase [Myxococcota bacterium]MBU1381411.1 glycosyltransferase [Myxococcota bacterium]MBU1498888.1 glycosyltransferase [Myxococcota bacterium]